MRRATADMRWRHRCLLQRVTATLLVCLCGCEGFAAQACPASSVSAPGSSLPDIVSRIRDVVFSRSASARGTTEAFAYLERGYAFKDLEQIIRYNSESAHEVEGTALQFELEDAPLESRYWWNLQFSDGAADLIRCLAETLDPEMKQISRVSVPRTPDVLRKALAQRDLLQTYSLLLAAARKLDDEESRARVSRLEDVIATALEATLLTDSDYQSLVAELPKALPAAYTSRQSYSLAQNYLPERVLVADDSWLEIPGTGRPFRHFVTYGGRSFVKVYVRAPHLSNEEMADLWKRLFAAYGNQLHLSAVKQTTPPGIETLLLRTFGVYLRDGTFRDSLWPEEVLIRILKYDHSEIDNGSSDFRGTLFFQYKLSRSALLAQPASLGLKRTLDDDRQFFGFLGDAPDRQHSHSETVTTMRSNCIACHSELSYGLGTIFAFERDPQEATRAPSLDSASRTQHAQEYPSQLPELNSILSRLKTRQTVMR